MNLTRGVLALRRRHAALRVGRFEALHADESLLVLRRQHEGDTVLAAFNLGTEPVAHTLAQSPQQAVEALTVNGARLDGHHLHLPPGAALVVAVNA